MNDISVLLNQGCGDGRSSQKRTNSIATATASTDSGIALKKIPTVAIINSKPRELLRLEGPTEPWKKRVIEMTQYVPLERHPLAPAIAVRPRQKHHAPRWKPPSGSGSPASRRGAGHCCCQRVAAARVKKLDA
ncbi:hypothetical protein JHK87_021463 [Glycine soja]|nr:hypothetical protein JHK87_021463 [Glycine soja]